MTQDGRGDLQRVCKVCGVVGPEWMSKGCLPETIRASETDHLSFSRVPYRRGINLPRRICTLRAMNRQVKQRQEDLVQHRMRTINMLRPRQIPRQLHRQRLLGLLLCPQRVTRRPMALVLLVQVAIVPSELRQDLGHPDPVLEHDAGDLDKVARAAVVVVRARDEFVDGVAELVEHGFELRVLEEGGGVGGADEAADEG